ncbi:hypothetical protein RUND412_002986 [Rhizina undulata]
MDDLYASPESDGHASPPSPTDTTFNMSIIPFKRRVGRIPHMNSVASTTVMSSSDEEEDDNTPSAPQLRMLTSSPSESHILVPTASNNEASASKRTQRPPGGDQTEENVDPNIAEASEPLPPESLKKSNPSEGASESEQEPDQNIDGSSNAIDPTTGLSMKVTVRKPRTVGPTEFVSSPPIRSANGTPRNRPVYLNWLTDESSMADADDESHPSSLRNIPRRKSPISRALDRSTMSGAFGSDEDSYLGIERDEKQSEIDFTDDDDSTPKKPVTSQGNPLDAGKFDGAGGSSPNNLSQITVRLRDQSDNSPTKDRSLPHAPKAVGKSAKQESVSPKDDPGNFSTTSERSNDSKQSAGRKRKHDEQLTENFDALEEDINETDEQEYTDEEEHSAEDAAPEKVTDRHSRSPPTKDDSAETEVISSNFTSSLSPSEILNLIDAQSATGPSENVATDFNETPKRGMSKSGEFQPQAHNGNGISGSPKKSSLFTPQRNTAVSESMGEYSQYFPYSEPPLASSTPKGTLEPFDLVKFKKSSRARRVSMNTPPSHLSKETSVTEMLNRNPDLSPLSSGYDFPSQPLRYETWDPSSVPLEFSPVFPVEGTVKRRNGAAPPPNSTNVTPVAKGLGEGAIPDDEIKEARGRGRSTSDPVDERPNIEPVIAAASQRGTVEGPDNMLFTPARVVRTRNVAGNSRNGANEKSKAVTSRVGSDRRSVSPAPVNSPRAESPSVVSDDNNPRDGNDDHQWSDFSQSFDEEDKNDNNSPTRTNGAYPVENSLSLENVVFGIETPASIGDAKYSTSHDDGHVSHISFHLARSRMGQTENANERLRDIMESRDIKRSVETAKVNSLTVPSSLRITSPSNRVHAPDEEVEALRKRLAALESTVKALREQEEKYKAEIKEQEGHVALLEETCSKAQKAAEENRSKIIELEGEAKKAQKKHEQELQAQQAQQDLLAQLRLEQGQEGRGQSRRWASAQDGPGSSEDEEKDDLRSYSILLDQQMADHERRRQEELEAQEAKFTQMLDEKEGLVQHLEQELREYQALARDMPADFSSSRLLDDDPEDWEDENDKSRDHSQFYDESFDQINGDGQNNDVDEAAQLAEMSLRRIAEEAGLEESLDKAQLAAFGIRQLRSDYDCLKKLLVESDGMVKSLMAANENTVKKVKELEDEVDDLESVKETLEKARNEMDGEMKKTGEQMETLKMELKAVEAKLMRSEEEKDSLRRDLQVSEAQIKTSIGEKEVLQRLLKQAREEKDQTKDEKETLQKQSIEAEERAQGFEEEIVKLRRDLAGTIEHAEYLEKDVISGLRQQVSELETTMTGMEKEKEKLVRQLLESKELVDTTQKENATLSSRLHEAQKVSEEVEKLQEALQKTEARVKELTEQNSSASQELQHLQLKLSQSAQTVQKLASEKHAIKESLDKELEASRARLARLNHDLDEKESAWNTLRTSLEGQLAEAKAALSAQSPERLEAYENSLAHILSEMSKDTYETADASLIMTLEKEFDEEIGNPAMVGAIVAGIRKLYDTVSEIKATLAETQEKNARWKVAVRRWEKEFKKERGRVDKLEKALKASEARLRAERVSSDEKINGLILALRR